MCLAIPGKVIEIFDESGLKMGRIDYAGTVNTVCLEYVPEIEVGQYTVVHAGFALSVIDPDEAMKSFETWEELVSKGGGDEESRADGLQTLRTMKENLPDKKSS